MENRLICICGPTASGKTALSVALAQQLHTEIISADSMQLYREMDIGTAKPDMRERQGVPHHLFDVCEPDEAFSVARYVELADAAAQDILSRGMTPIVVGGTGLYMDALIECSVFSGDETDLTVREKYQRMAAQQGNQAVHDCLAKVDPAGAERLHPNNLKRVIRALEVYERLVERCLLTCTAAQAIGYKELLGYLNGEQTLEECTELLKRRSRNYAKRQLTWLKRDDSIHWIYYNSGEELPFVLQETTKYLQNHGVQ